MLFQRSMDHLVGLESLQGLSVGAVDGDVVAIRLENFLDLILHFLQSALPVLGKHRGRFLLDFKEVLHKKEECKEIVFSPTYVGGTLTRTKTA
jgi:hypothetical protein